MPIYEYRCKECAGKFEKFVRSAADHQVTCPQCSSEAVEKIPSAFAVGRAQPSAAAGASCCGLADACSDPKRCCER